MSHMIDSTTFRESKKSVGSVSLTANTWVTIGTITLPAHTTGIVTASAYVAAASGSGRFTIRITGAGGTVHGTSNAALSTASTTRATTCAVYNHNGDSDTTWLAQAHCDLATTLTWGEIAILALPQADTSGNLVS